MFGDRDAGPGTAGSHHGLADRAIERTILPTFEMYDRITPTEADKTANESRNQILRGTFAEVKLHVQIGSLPGERRHLAFRALAIEIMISAYKQMPALISVEGSSSPMPDELSD